MSKNFLDYNGLSLFKSKYDTEISDSISSNIELAVSLLNFNEIGEENKYVSKISQTDGIIHAELSDIPVTGVSDHQITIKQGTETKGTFTLNDDTDTTITLDAQVQSDWNASSGLAQIANKPTVVTSWSSTTSDTNLPSEKLAKDSFDLKADLTNETQIITAQEFNAVSSKKLKKCIVPSEVNALDIINNTDMKDFFYKTDRKKTNPRIGFISEDTNPLLSTKNQNRMDISNCIGVLLKAVQELSKEVEELKAKLGE